MKTMRKTSSILILIGLTCCNLSNNKSVKTLSADTVKVQIDSEYLPRTGELYKKTSQLINEERQQDKDDNINLVRTLDLALKIANDNKGKDNFNILSDTMSIYYGNIFSSKIKHLIIKRSFQYSVNADIYKLSNNNFEKVCSKDMAPMAYIGDTVQDVNGDGRLDYLFHWYPMSGCCLRDIYDIYLQKTNGEFTTEIEFINPNFSAKEKTIRGLRYGWSAPLYKYKWNGYKVDTIEYIYFPDSTNGNHFIRRKQEDENEKGEIIKQLPDEYKQINCCS